MIFIWKHYIPTVISLVNNNHVNILLHHKRDAWRNRFNVFTLALIIYIQNYLDHDYFKIKYISLMRSFSLVCITSSTYFIIYSTFYINNFTQILLA